MGPGIRIRTEAGEQELELEEFEARVRRGELAGHCPVNFYPVTGGNWVRADSLDIFRALHRPRTLYFARAFNLGRFPRLTALLVLLNVALYMVMNLEGPIDDDQLVLWGAKVAPLILDLGEYWRLLTANLVHKDQLHIAFNLFVLFNVGGALENVYRPVDYLWLLFVSALGASVTSLVAMPDAQSAGSSGVVYGALGALLVFGLRYRELLPARYRGVLGDAILPVVVVFLFIGFTSAGVDNWAHVGGLVSGAVAAFFVQPRLLADARITLRSALLRLVPMVLISAGLCAAGWLTPGQTRTLVAQRDDGFGIEASVPRYWRKGTNRFGQAVYYNGLPGVGRASLSAQATSMTGCTDPLESGDGSGPPRCVEEALETYVQRHLVTEERAGVIRDVAVHAPMPAELGGSRGLMVQSSYSEDGYISFQRAFFVPRGEFVYQLVFQWSQDFPRYEALLDQMASSVRFFEPKALREARARALMYPGSADAQAVLGETLRRLGEHAAAVAALTRAAELAPTSAHHRAQLAEALLLAGEHASGCREAERAAELSEIAPALEALSTCHLLGRDRPRAIRLLRRAAELAPMDVRLASRLQKLVGEP